MFIYKSDLEKILEHVNNAEKALNDICSKDTICVGDAIIINENLIAIKEMVKNKLY